MNTLRLQRYLIYMYLVNEDVRSKLLKQICSDENFLQLAEGLPQFE